MLHFQNPVPGMKGYEILFLWYAQLTWLLCARSDVMNQERWNLSPEKMFILVFMQITAVRNL